ncbi:hypothetical protein NUR12_004263 [Salmonella enterica]|nr:hypothetical protein [Salmonella enterica]EEM9540008.1 hypothetical protein [Salmonella enterica]EEN0874104.1 hypothetical protein [Salmonella enterica]EEN1611276.1 hypothetical protein [Salmonella enterica]EFQ3472745.1 hypothetical protein [Salmonella enterica]
MPLLSPDQVREINTLWVQNDVTDDFPSEAGFIMKKYGLGRNSVVFRGSLHCDDVAVYIREKAGWKWLCMAEEIFNI